MIKSCEQINFYYCKHCGKIIAMVKDSGTATICCGEAMVELKPGTTDGSSEKHVPVVKKMECTAIVSVGSEPHPMTKEHYIEWILLQTSKGIHTKCLNPGDEPIAEFKLDKDEKVKAAYEFCNIHKLWKCC